MLCSATKTERQRGELATGESACFVWVTELQKRAREEKGETSWREFVNRLRVGETGDVNFSDLRHIALGPSRAERRDDDPAGGKPKRGKPKT